MPKTYICKYSGEMKPQEISTDDVVTVPKIAQATGHHRVSVYDAIERLGIKPQFVLGKISYYHRETIDRLAEAMRPPRQGGAQ